MSKQVQNEIKKLSLKMDQITRTGSILNSNQVQKIFNSTPARYKYKRPAKGGGEWTYVRASYIRRTLDGLFGFNWDLDIDTSLAEAFEVASKTNACVVKGTLTGRVKHDGEWVEIKRTSFGRAEVKWQTETIKGEKQRKRDDFSGSPLPLDFGNDMKAAVSDCLKKCASMMGIAADVYDPQEFIEIHVEGSEEAEEKQKSLEERIKQARKSVKEQAKEVKSEA